jgi:hypothetical protein
VAYREALRVPASWWVLAAVGVVALFLAYDVALGPGIAVLAGGLGAVACGAWLWTQGAVVVGAGRSGLVAGRAHLPADAIGTVEALDAAATTTARGAGADPHGFFLLKGYVATSVRVWVDDRDDPVPYWLVSTRNPRALASALADARDAARSVR